MQSNTHPANDIEGVAVASGSSILENNGSHSSYDLPLRPKSSEESEMVNMEVTESAKEAIGAAAPQINSAAPVAATTSSSQDSPARRPVHRCPGCRHTY